MERGLHNRSGARWIIGAAALGAAAMYLFDPQHGKRRRALAMDKVNSVSIKTRKMAEKRARDLSNRAQGMLAKTKRMSPEMSPDQANPPGSEATSSEG